jgi:predicted dehydrogenase
MGDKVVTNDSRSLRVALVGCGHISGFHVAALKAVPGVEIVAVCDLDERAVRETASRHAIPRCYNDLEAMAQELRLDAVHLLTPPRSHLPLARIAARHRVHMYIEKPLASTEAHARAILSLARDAGVQVCTGHSRLFDPVFVEASRRVRAGDIGRVISVRAEQGFTHKAAENAPAVPWSHGYDWGIFDNLICHPLYLACHFLEDPGVPQVVGYNLGTIPEAGVEEIRVLIPSATGIGEVSLSLCSSPEVNRVEVVGTKGRVSADWRTMTVLTSRENGRSAALARFTGNFSTALALTRSGVRTLYGIATRKVKRYQGIRTLVARFYQSLREGAAPPVPPEHGLLNVQLMDQIKEACQGARKRSVPQADAVGGGST